MKKIIVWSSAVVLSIAGMSSFAGPKLPKVGKQIGKTVKFVERVVRKQRQVGTKRAIGIQAAKTGRLATGKIRPAATVSGAVRTATTKQARPTAGLSARQASAVERQAFTAQQAAQRTTVLPRTQEAEIITQTISTLNKKTDEYICTFGFADEGFNPIYKEDGAFVSIGDSEASIADVEARIRQARQANPKARFLILHTRVPFANLTTKGEVGYTDGYAIFERTQRAKRNLREYVYDLEDNTLIGVYEDVPELPEGTIRFILDRFE